MTDKKTIRACVWAGVLAAVTAGLGVRLVLGDKLDGPALVDQLARPAPNVVLTTLLFAVCVGVVVGCCWAEVLKQREEGRRRAAAAADVEERNAQALEELVAWAEDLVGLVRAEVSRWGDVAPGETPRAVVLYAADVLPLIEGQTDWMTAIGSGAQGLITAERPIKPGRSVADGKVRVIDWDGDRLEFSVQVTTSRYLVVGGHTQGTATFVVEEVTPLNAQEARERGIARA